MAEISKEMYDELRRILEKQNSRSYTFSEVKEIGDGLVDFFALFKTLDDEILSSNSAQQ